MPEEVRGLNVKFDADFSEFKKNLKSADKDISSTEKQLKSLQSSLKIEWDPKKFQQAQSKAQEALDGTQKKLDLLRSRLEYIEKAGVTDKTRDEYNWLQEQISKTELQGQRLEQQLKDLDDIKLTNLTKGFDEAANKLDKLSSKTKGLSIATAVLGAGLIATGLKTVEHADEIATLATQYDMTTDAIQRFNYVALQTDTEAEQLYKAFVKVQGGVADLKTGVESVSTKALNQLGLSFDQFSGKEEQFYAIIDALANMEDQAKMVSLANDIFGERMATNLFPLIYAGTDAIEQYKSEFESLGALTEEQVKELAEFDNVMNELKAQYANTALQLGSSLLPVLKDLSDILVNDILPVIKDVIDWFSGLSDSQKSTVVSILLLLSELSPLFEVLSFFPKAISSVVAWLNKLDDATLTSYRNWSLLGAAILTIFNVLANWSNMNPVQKIIALLGSLSAAALAAAIAFGVFHSAWSVGLAVGGIITGIATATAAVRAAGKDINSEVSFPDATSYSPSFPEYDIPSYPYDPSSTVNNTTSSYVDNSNVYVTIEKNDYMTEEEIIQAVNKGLKKAKQART